MIINPVEFGSGMTGYDGLTVVTVVEMSMNQMQKLFSFTNSFQEKYLEIFYKDKTLMFRRYFPGTMDYYDYTLYDQLFANQITGKFEVRLYCTGFFFWMQVAVNGGNFLSPVYFGLDTPNKANMQELIDANSRARISIGDISNPGVFSIYGATLYAFHYEDLRQDIQTRFSRPTAATAVDSNEDEDYYY